MSKWGYPNGREKKIYSTVFCSKFKTECCHYATKKYWITIIFSDKYCVYTGEDIGCNTDHIVMFLDNEIYLN